MKFKPHKIHFIIVGLAAAVLLVAGLFLYARLKFLKDRNAKNISALNQVLPGFNNQSLEKFKQDVQGLKVRLAGLSGVFDPKERWFKKNYDLTIHFVEELGKINEFLRTKSIEKKANFPDIVFKEKLPSEQEAFYLLSQLYGIQEVVSLAMDYNITFKSIMPQGIENAAGLPGIRTAKSSIELVCPTQELIEFIIQLNDIVPKPIIESVYLRSKDAVFEINLTITNIVMDLPWKDKGEIVVSGKKAKDVLPKTEQDSIRILRNMNPFFVPAAEPVVEASPAVKAVAAPPGPRFLFRGKARLKSKEVVAIEDTLNKETVFLGQGEKIGNFIVKEFSEKEALLENTDDLTKLIIKQEEK